MKNNLLILDVETGGRDEEKNPITQLALQVVEPIKFDVLHRFEIILKPYNNLVVEKDAVEYTRLTVDQIARGADCMLAVKGIIEACKLANPSGKSVTAPILVGHNIAFDKKFLVYLFKYRSKNFFDYVNDNLFDTLTQCKLHEAGQLKAKDINSYRLTTCCERFGIALKTAHGAPADVEATRLLMKKLFQSLRNTKANEVTSSEPASKSVRARDGFKFEF